jgi:hypothetical protein
MDMPRSSLRCMGYDLHVFRGDEWFEAEPISAAEWAEAVAQNSDINRTGSVAATTPDRATIRLDHEGLAEWTGHSSGEPVPLLFDGGQVVVKNPTRRRSPDWSRSLTNLVRTSRAMTASPTPNQHTPPRITSPVGDGSVAATADGQPSAIHTHTPRVASPALI